jgi:hypothetical protein
VSVRANLDRYRLELEFAATLGMDYYGTGGDPSGSRFTADWDVAADRWNTLGQIARDEYGIRLYTHTTTAAPPTLGSRWRSPRSATRR